jgi:hypothetical protein
MEGVIMIDEIYDLGDPYEKYGEFIKFLQFAYLERAQLYATIITLLLLFERNEVEIDFTTFEDIGEKYHAAFTKSEKDGYILLKLLRHEEETDESI